MCLLTLWPVSRVCVPDWGGSTWDLLKDAEAISTREVSAFESGVVHCFVFLGVAIHVCEWLGKLVVIHPSLPQRTHWGYLGPLYIPLQPIRSLPPPPPPTHRHTLNLLIIWAPGPLLRLVKYIELPWLHTTCTSCFFLLVVHTRFMVYNQYLPFTVCILTTLHTHTHTRSRQCSATYSHTASLSKFSISSVALSSTTWRFSL